MIQSSPVSESPPLDDAPSLLERASAFLTEWIPNRPLQAMVVVVLFLVLAKVVDKLVTRTLILWSRKTPTDLDDRIVALLHGPIIRSTVLMGLWIAASRWEFTQSALLTTHHLIASAGLLVWTLFALRLCSLLVLSASKNPTRFKAVEQRTYPLFDNLGKLTLLATTIYGLILIWEVDATGWLASAGLVGVAVGFAAKDSLANLFAGVFIIADAPYQVGDYIVFENGTRGEVIHIGLRSTRVVTRDDVEITVPNSVIGAGRITNQTRGPSSKMRIRIKVGVAYGSDVSLVRQVLLDAAAGEDLVCDNPVPRIRFRAFGESSLDFELLCWITEPVLRGRTTDALNTAIYDLFAASGIQIPFPQRDVHLITGAAAPLGQGVGEGGGET
jgi:small-conductance mechanosensitive channel